MGAPLYLRGMLGLGDNLYQRAVVRELGEVYLVTSWPQIYAGLPVHCVRPATRLRTQIKNARRDDLPWAQADRAARWRPIGYDARGTLLDSLLRSVGLTRERVIFDGPPVSPVRAGRYVVIRPATLRQEWRADARNPDPAYLVRAAKALRPDYTIISIADLAPGQEWAVEPLPDADERYHKGEINAEGLLALVAHAAGVIGGVGWLLPAALAYRRPMLLIHGGWGHSNGPQRIFDPRIDDRHVVQATPDPYCVCNDKFHACPKTIPDFDRRLDAFQSALALAA